MQGKTRELWLDICAQAAVEEDPDELLKLIREIDRLLEEKNRRLKIDRRGPPPSIKSFVAA